MLLPTTREKKKKVVSYIFFLLNLHIRERLFISSCASSKLPKKKKKKKNYRWRQSQFLKICLPIANITDSLYKDFFDLHIKCCFPRSTYQMLFSSIYISSVVFQKLENQLTVSYIFFFQITIQENRFSYQVVHHTIKLTN